MSPTFKSLDTGLTPITPISMRIPEACQFTGLGRSTLYLLIASNEVEVVKIGASTLVLTESLTALIERRRKAGRLNHATR